MLFLSVVFGDIPIAQCQMMRKSRDSATNCVWDLWVFAFENVRIDMPGHGVHDGVRRSPFALVLATGLLPKGQPPYQGPERLLDRRFLHRLGERCPGRRACRARLRMTDAAYCLTKLPDQKLSVAL